MDCPSCINSISVSYLRLSSFYLSVAYLLHSHTHTHTLIHTLLYHPIHHTLSATSQHNTTQPPFTYGKTVRVSPGFAVRPAASIGFLQTGRLLSCWGEYRIPVIVIALKRWAQELVARLDCFLDRNWGVWLLAWLRLVLAELHRVPESEEPLS